MPIPNEIPDPGPTLRHTALPLEPGDTVDAGAGNSGEADFTLTDLSFLSPPLAPEELGWLGHYRVLELLGQGGMGAVFRAEDTHLLRPVALKVILPKFAANLGARERFLREARACAGIKNDHVVTIYQVGQDREVPFLAMELLQGQTLEDRLRKEGPLPLAEVLRIGREVAAGLAAAHAQGLIHRDVKPANVWLEAPGGRVKLLDFGLARVAGARSGLTGTGDVVGTPDFMSPEQARGRELDLRTDLFSLGGILYAMCAGVKPFHGNTAMAVLTSLAVDTPQPLVELNGEVPAPLDELVGRLLQKDPADRPASAAEVSGALAAIEARMTAPTLTRPRLEAPPVAPGPAASPAAGPAPAGRLPRWLLPVGVGAAFALLGALLAAWFKPQVEGQTSPPGRTAPAGPPVRIGVLHSHNGTMALSERPVIDAVLLAVEELNQGGGVLGRPVEAVLADGQSDEAVFARQAEKLIREDKVCTLFGCWTSASRKAVVPVVERLDQLLFYPVQYEGVEQSPHVVYLGPVPNQQILPALRWLVGFENRRRWFLVGSNYVFPLTANVIIRAEAKARGCEVVGEKYLPLACTEVGDVVKEIVKSKADLIVNTVNGDTNVALFRALRRAGVAPPQTLALSTSISGDELSALGPRATAGDYLAANYFQSIDTPANRAFVSRFQKRYGSDRVISGAMQTAYSGVHLWAKAVQAAGRAEAQAIREAVKGQTYEAPQGLVRIDPATLHAVQTARIARVEPTGQLMQVYCSPQAIAAEPFPEVLSREEWTSFIDGLRRRWGGRWSYPGP
jgi:urea transport system substrate-binding protein